MLLWFNEERILADSPVQGQRSCVLSLLSSWTRSRHEKQMIRTGGCGQGCVGECDLPDQYSDQPKGLVQGLQVKKEFPEFKKVASAKGLPQKLIATEATKQIRPFALMAYFPIIRDSPVYPVVYDANGVVLSLPPIINGDHSKISTTLVQYPELAFRKETILTAKANVYIGIDESAEALDKMLNRLFPTKQNASNQLEVLIPPTRHDMLHVCDIEDVGAYGYNRIPKTLPATMHIARQCPLNKQTKQLLSDVVLAEVGANERRVCAVKLLDCVSCYWDALGQEAGLLPARPRVVISAMLAAQVHSLNPPHGAQLVSDLPAQFNCPQKYATLKSSDRSSPTENDAERRIRVVHLVSRNALAEQIFMDWHQKFGQNSGCKPFLDRMADKTLKELLGHVEKYLESMGSPTSDKDSDHPLVDLHHEDPEWLELRWTGVQRRSVNQRC
ncbi:phenylalanyl-tRNA synthetase beta chain [Culex quinquefasciatus]|uniref:Phenylalanyl-tRNA synthetase beta chain n=1 Tax=Culex quinquefasciatus TaxID=7176 RepID=B0X0M1_CULQU|nr:phenylalanyl-tRNA synthetase beta chain [Culex quinquefasciatus]|eukprot:XP_001863193.1 phenylalanyl-tRNA synthetase beta chain [Culex quinquefasciatus]